MPQNIIHKPYLILLLGILAALGPFSIDMYLPAFGSIAESLSTDERHVTFTLTSYFSGIAIGQLFYGPIVDKYGRKKPLLAGLAIYALGSLGCALSPNIETMIGMRTFQALGGCVGMVASNAIISDVYERSDRARAFSYIMLVMGVAPLIAPSVGSLFIEKADWNYIFYFLALFASLVFGLILFTLPETSRFMHQHKLKVNNITAGYFRIAKNRTFLLYTLAGSITMSILFAHVASAAFIFLTYYQLDKATFSILFAINATGLIAGSYLNGILTKRVDFIRIANAASLLLTLVSSVVLTIVLLNPKLPYPWVSAGIFLILFLTGLINPNATAASLAPFTGNVGAASALGGAIRMGTGAIVAASIGIFQGESAVTMFATIFALAAGAALLLRWAGIPQRKDLLVADKRG
jgi:DHA1 family bicyclomycin/chloramphenicol resistance-like MFS transporter